MENKTQETITPVQPIAQISVSPSTKWLKILLFVLLGFVIVAGSVFAGIQIGKNQAQQTMSEVVQPTAIPTEPLTPAEPSSIPAVIISPLNTQDWKRVQNNGVYFKIPANAKCDNDSACTEVTYPIVYQGKLMPAPARILIKVTDYLGGSRRAQYFSYKEADQECRPIFVETKFGSVDALQIATDGGWCQGGYNGGIVAVIGNKFVTIGPGLNYNDNKEIARWDERDTLVSTLTSN